MRRTADPAPMERTSGGAAAPDRRAGRLLNARLGDDQFHGETDRRSASFRYRVFRSVAKPSRI